MERSIAIESHRRLSASPATIWSWLNAGDWRCEDHERSRAQPLTVATLKGPTRPEPHPAWGQAARSRAPRRATFWPCRCHVIQPPQFLSCGTLAVCARLDDHDNKVKLSAFAAVHAEHGGRSSRAVQA